MLGSKDNVDYSDLTKLPIVSNCLKEALRLSPPASIIGVETPKDFVIPHDEQRDHKIDGTSTGPCLSRQEGKSIPAGTRTLISMYTMHRHSHLWSNAEKFLPSRWSAKTTETTTPFAFIPFSVGSRNCIGQV